MEKGKIMSLQNKYVICLMLMTIASLLYFYTNHKVITSKSTKKDSVIVSIGIENYEIPKNYISPNNDLPDSINRDSFGYVGVNLFFPDLIGYKENDLPPGIGPHNPRRVIVEWTEVNKGQRYNAEKLLSNELERKLITREQSVDVGNLIAYRHKLKSGYVYYNNNMFSHGVHIDCYDGVVSSFCRLSFVDEQSDRGVFAIFEKGYLEKWFEIRNRILYLIKQWEILRDN